MGQNRTAKNDKSPSPQTHLSRTRARVARTGSKEHLKPNFLAAYAEHKTISAAAAATGVSRWTVQDWRKDDEEFEKSFTETKLGTDELMEANAVKFSIDGVPQYVTNPITGKLILDKETGRPILAGLKHDTKLLQFMVERRMPDRYGRQADLGDLTAFVKQLIARAVEAINTSIPTQCPACKTDLRLKDKIAEHLLALSSTMKAAS